jgi:hypothetical protein
MIRSLFILLLPLAITAQTDPAVLKPDSSISGLVLAAGSGTPLPEVAVSINTGGRNEVSTKTDSQGHYELRGLPAGDWRVVAAMPYEGRPRGLTVFRQITLSGGQALTQIDFHLKVFGRFSGRILDENKEAMPGISVILVAREYSLGALRYVYAEASSTNDLGEYTMGRVEAGRGFLLMAQKRRQRLPAIADTPADPAFRRRVPVTTWYPGSTAMQGAQPITLRPGEEREGVNIQMGRAPAFCVDGGLAANGKPGPLWFEISDASPTSGASGNGAMFMGSPNGTAGDDGRFRICDLAPGSYTLTAYTKPPGAANGPAGAPEFFSASTLTITDRDIHDVTVAPRPRLTIPGEVFIEGPPPEKPVTGKLNFSLSPMTRAPFGGEFQALNPRPDIPGAFSLDAILIDEYSIRWNNPPAGLYIKEALYGGRNIYDEPMRVGGDAADAGIRITLGQDGGRISARVQDTKGNPLADSWVVVMPDHIASEAVLAARFLSGQTDQNGTWKSPALAPGKYYVLALDAPVNRSPEDIAKLWQARTHAEEAQVPAGSNASVNLTGRVLE